MTNLGRGLPSRSHWSLGVKCLTVPVRHVVMGIGQTGR